ncbi:ABC transporter substrate-binding protein [Pseudooceanicola aestuarii]|uniref:ABC transporter substrate-binding protein n=1 Tax=Pseudooceanicola aestuarii TaxID=2697319 RepID=UPI0013D5CBBC|nr:ABC transporter substrate-binding protein [Pseudooceanicola aestuarii]
MTHFAKVTAALAALAASPALAQSVTDDTINLGILTDLSGPVAIYGSESLNGLRMAIDEINGAGGIHGRKVNLVVEDHSYDPKKAVLAANKMITRDEVFAIVGHLGTATNMAVMPLLLENKVFNIMPQGASPGLYEPASPYKMAMAPSYADAAAASLVWAFEELKPNHLCALYQDDDFGRSSLAGVEAFSEAKGVEIVEATSYKRGATDFSSQIQRLSAADCDFVYNASTLREFVGSVTEARKIGYDPIFLGTLSNYAIQVPALGGEAMEGVYAAAFIPIPYADDPNPAVAEWVAKYTDSFGEAPGLYSMFAYYAMQVFAAVAENAGADLTPESFAASANETELPVDALGNPAFNISEDDRLSNRQVRITRVANGKWENVTDLLPARDF